MTFFKNTWNSLKAFIYRTSLAVFLLVLFLLLDIFTLIQMFLSLVFGKGKRGWRIAVSKDQLGNVAMGGHEDETFSSRCYRMRKDPKYRRYMNMIDFIFLVLAKEVDHCKVAYYKEKQACKERFKPIPKGD